MLPSTSGSSLNACFFLRGIFKILSSSQDSSLEYICKDPFSNKVTFSGSKGLTLSFFLGGGVIFWPTTISMGRTLWKEFPTTLKLEDR